MSITFHFFSNFVFLVLSSLLVCSPLLYLQTSLQASNSPPNLRMNLPPQVKPTHPLLFTPYRTFKIREFCVYKRRRLKSSPKLSIRGQLPPFDGNFHDIFSQFPSPESVGILAPVLGFASGVAAYVSQFSSSRASSNKTSDVGEWIMFTSPTTFNRFVILRCPSISIEGGELLEDVNEKLIKEGRHFVKFNSGRMLVRGGDESESGAGGWEERLEYQRVCVNTEDGGVISMDWPANLDLEQEHGLDTTVLLVPGTPEGSMDKNVRSFVGEALLRGFFPIVMNPRGCAGSPLTTARLFTAADSDDICTAIQFVNKARPWTTLMAVGWAYGANMLTKYLAEVGEKTPLTAATCIDNPFDLEEATKSALYNTALNQKFTGGMIDILRSNKELFQGRAKGFDVEKALAAKSVRDFETAISMVSYGFKAVGEFYSKSCTREVVGNVMIPVLFIQNDDGTAPIFSIPRSLIAENPFTSLLLCSCLPSNVVASNRAARSWCQLLTIEWLTAVELGLLKGRHPLLKDIDVSINPSKGLSLVAGRASDKGGQVNKLLDVSRSRSNTLNANTADAVKKMLEDSDTAASIHLKSSRYLGKKLDFENGRSQEGDDYAFQRTGSVDAELVKGEQASPVDGERGQVLETAHVVMNMLDVILPGTLTEEKKQKVLTAVDQGETFMKALQDVVPEDVREKLTAAASGILHAQSTNLKLDRLRIPTVSSSSKVKVQDKLREASSAYQVEKTDNSAGSPESNQPGTDQPAVQVESELQPAENKQKSTDLGQSQDDMSNSVRKDTDESERIHEAHEFIKEKETSYSDSSAKEQEMRGKPSSSTNTEKAVITEESAVNEHKAENVGTAPVEAIKSNIEKTEERNSDSSLDQTKTARSMMEEGDSPVELSSDAQIHMIDEGVDGNQKKESKIMQPVLDQNKPSVFDSNSPTFNVSQALDALTGMDDSTQVAVNSVFGVIENMLSQLEENHDEIKTGDRSGVMGEKKDSAPDTQDVSRGHEFKLTEGGMNDQSENSDNSNNSPACNFSDSEDSIDVDGGWEEEPTQNPVSYSGNDFDGSQGVDKASYIADEEKKKHCLVGSTPFGDYSKALLNNLPLYIIARAYGDPYLNKFSLSKIPNKKALDLDTTTALLLDYFPEEDQWKLLEPGKFGDSIGDTKNHKDNDGKVPIDSPKNVNDRDTCIEPPYVILDTENQHEPVGENDKNVEYQSEELVQLVKCIITEALRIEVGRKLSAADINGVEPGLSSDLLEVANAVSLAVKVDKHHFGCLGAKDFRINSTSKKFGTLHGEQIIESISSAVQRTSYLRRVLPVGVIVGSSLAALRKYVNVTSAHDNGQRSLDQTEGSGGRCQAKANLKETYKNGSLEETDLDSSVVKENEEFKLKNLHNDSVMVGAVTAAIGASALLAQQETSENSSKSPKERGIHHKEVDRLDEATSDKNQNSIVTSLAEKAMSVAGPVVPIKQDGEVDQERLVAMLADLGQKGGVLRLVSKLALLWGGIRGAVSLTEKLLSFLHISERPLLQRILGFVGMVLVLWSPVIIPLLPTLVQSWTTNHPARFAELVCIIGLYIAVMILVMLWGRRIRGYEDPLRQYGLDLASPPKIQNLLKGFIGGVTLVLAIQCIYALLGCVTFCWPSSLPTSTSDAVMWLKVYSRLLVLVVRGTVVATCVVLVEELLFRSWLTEEVATDLGYERGIVISGLAFSLSQRSMWAIPGLWLFSLALAGIRQRSQGSLSIPIGLRAGMVATSFILKTGGFVTYKPDFPFWVIGTRAFEPLGGAVGVAFSLLLAVILHPRQTPQKKSVEE